MRISFHRIEAHHNNCSLFIEIESSECPDMQSDVLLRNTWLFFFMEAVYITAIDALKMNHSGHFPTRELSAKPVFHCIDEQQQNDKEDVSLEHQSGASSFLFWRNSNNLKVFIRAKCENKRLNKKRPQNEQSYEPLSLSNRILFRSLSFLYMYNCIVYP